MTSSELSAAAAPPPATSVAEIQRRACYPLSEAARLLGEISRSTLYKMVQRGELATVHVGSRRMVPHSEIVRLTFVDPSVR